jgi:hypothetical protein
MMLLLLILLQAERRLSPFVIIGAALLFVAGVSLLVYFYRRYKRLEKETEDDWDSARRSLFVKDPLLELRSESAVESAVRAQLYEEPKEAQLPVATGTRELAADVALSSFSPVTAAEAEPQLSTPAVEEPIQPPVAPKPEARPAEIEPPVIQRPEQRPAETQPAVTHKPDLRPTEILGSVSIVEPVKETHAQPEAAPPVERVQSDVESPKPPPQRREPKPAIPPQVVAPEPLNVARVETRSHREPFESPRIERISEREAYEPPIIEPLTPREAAATRELRSAQLPKLDTPAPERTKESFTSQGTMRLASTPAAKTGTTESPSVWGETSKLTGQPLTRTPRVVTEPMIPAGGLRTHRTGSVLGLPAEASHQPLVLGEPGRDRDEVGIGALTNYGRDVGPKAGRAGTIALLAVLLVLGVALGLYFFVPSVHSRVGAFVAHLRGTDTQAAIEAAMKPKAQVIPSTRPEVNKNLVTARGAVDNISDEPLENLAVEVSLQRGGGAPPEVRTVSVTPNPLPPGVRGIFEFEYDGKRDTGFLGYTITKLYSNGTEVRFRAPGQK